MVIKIAAFPKEALTYLVSLLFVKIRRIYFYLNIYCSVKKLEQKTSWEDRQ